MRATTIIVLAFAIGVAIASSKNRNYSHFVKQHARLRVIRGFKPEYISTAYGFGKRQSTVDVPKLNKEERILSILLQYFPQGIPVDRLLQQMKSNPAFTAKNPNPKGITWLF